MEKDKKAIQKRSASAIVERIEESGIIIGAIASTESRDRMGDVILADGWEIENFKKQPRLLWGHEQHSLPIGKVTDIGVQNKKLVFNAEFVDGETYPFAQQVRKMMEKGFLNTFSVGFIPLDFDGEGRISRAELLEISVVNVPANAEAATRSAEYKSFELEAKKAELEFDKKDEENHKEVKVETIKVPIEQMKNLLSALKIANSDAQILKNTVSEALKQSAATAPKQEKIEKAGSPTVDKHANTVRKALVIIQQASELANRHLKNKGN